MTSKLPALCPCGSGASTSDCCYPLIQGKREAARAQDLLRARYSAFVLGEVDFVLSSHHSRTAKDIRREEIEDWSRNSEWLGMQVVQVEAGEPQDSQGTVVFCAKYRPAKSGQAKDGQEEADEVQEHWEQAIFEKESGQWKFLDARAVHTGTYRRPEPKTGRNDPCPCGSGKKYKKCCA